MYLSILFLPLLGSMVAGLLGRKLGSTGAQFITISSLAITSVMVLVAFYEVGLCASPVYIKLPSWIDSGLLNVSWGFSFDSLSVVMLIPILLVSTFVQIYTVDYMREDPEKCSGKTFAGYKLPNSGNTLKLKVPSHSRKIMSGWSNYSGMVTSLKMNESKMGNRGSKSNIQTIFVKEQRVDGSWWRTNLVSYLRCTLMGFERNYQTKIPSKQLPIGTLSCNSPWFWTGLIDAEGSFSIIVSRSKTHKSGWKVEPKFQMGLDKSYLLLLEQFKEFYGNVGQIYTYPTRTIVNYSIGSGNDLNMVTDHLDRYPLCSQKAADYILFKKVLAILKTKSHLSIEGLYEVINLKASINLGLSSDLKSEFPLYIPCPRPVIQTQQIPNSNWISGFVSGEGNFDIKIAKQSTNKIGSRVQLRFRISQHDRDIILMESISKFLDAGKVYKYGTQPAVVLTVFSYSDITNKIIPFFDTLGGLKLKNYIDWCKAAKIMQDGLHHTTQGLDSIKEIKSGVNRGRQDR